MAHSVDDKSGFGGALTKSAAAAVAVLSIYVYRRYRKSIIPQRAPERPQLVLDSIKDNVPIYYFGVGSNLSRKKLENRSICGSKIKIISMEPCVIPGFRLAFNTRAFPPLEPAMGSLEPLPGKQNGHDPSETTLAQDGHDPTATTLRRRRDSMALSAYENEECHGALIKLSVDDYERVYKSEGGGSGDMQVYEEIVVTCVPYDESHPPVQAVAFRAREKFRLEQDLCPSKRYMNIIREGAMELGLKPCYQDWLAAHPIQQPPSKLLKMMAINSILFTVPLSMGLKFRLLNDMQTYLLFKFYVASSEPKWKQILGELAVGAILFPTAICGFVLRGTLELTGLMPAVLKKWVESF